MKRKLMRLGPATYVASLPSKWIRKNHLEKGDYLEFEEKESSLVISTKKKSPNLEVTLDLKKLNSRLIYTYVQSYYLLGYDKIILLHNPEVLEYKTGEKINSNKFIQNLVNKRFIGIEVIEQTENKTILMDLGGINEEAREQIFKRLIFLIKTMAEDCYESIKSKNQNLLLTIKDQRYNNINRFIMHYQRITAKACREDAIKYAYAIQLLTQFKAITGTYRHIASVSTELDNKVSNRILEVLKTVNKSLDTVLNLCLSFSEEKSLNFIQDREKVWNTIDEKKDKFDKNDLRIFAEIRALMFPTYMILKSTTTLHHLDKSLS